MHQGTPTSITLDAPVPQPRPPQDGVEYNGKTGLWYNSSICKNGCVEIGDSFAVPVKTVAVLPANTTATTTQSGPEGPAYVKTGAVPLHYDNSGSLTLHKAPPPDVKPCGTFLVIHHAPNWVVQYQGGEHGDSFQIADGGVGCPPPAKPGHGLEIALALVIVYLWGWGTFVLSCVGLELGRTPNWKMALWPIMWLTPDWWRK